MFVCADEREQPLAVLADARRDLAAGRQRLVEQHAPGVAVLVDEGEEGVQAAAQRVGRAVGMRDGGADDREHRVAGALHAREVEPLLVAEVRVEQGLRHAGVGRDVVHRDGPEAVRGEARVRDVEDLPLALGARQAGALGMCHGGMCRHSVSRLPRYKFICESDERVRSEGGRRTQYSCGRPPDPTAPPWRGGRDRASPRSD